MPNQIAGNVYWIQDGRLTNSTVDVREAFTDPDQAKAQVLNAEASGNQKWIKLVRLAYRQFQGMRYRGASKATRRRAADVTRHRVTTSSRKESLKAVKPQKPNGGKVARKTSVRKAIKKAAIKKVSKKK
jgi:hypothetical protein